MAMDFSKKCEILSELWMNYRGDKDFQDFIIYNDIGLPLSYYINTEIVSPLDEAYKYVEETYLLFCAAVGVDDEKEYDNLNDIFKEASE